MDELVFGSCKNRFYIVLLIMMFVGILNNDQQAPKLPFKKKMSEPACAGTIFVIGLGFPQKIHKKCKQ